MSNTSNHSATPPKGRLPLHCFMIAFVLALLPSSALGSWSFLGGTTNASYSGYVTGTSYTPYTTWRAEAGGTVSCSYSATNVTVALTEFYCESDVKIDADGGESNWQDALSWASAQTYGGWTWAGPPGGDTNGVAADLNLNIEGTITVDASGSDRTTGSVWVTSTADVYGRASPVTFASAVGYADSWLLFDTDWTFLPADVTIDGEATGLSTFKEIDNLAGSFAIVEMELIYEMTFSTTYTSASGITSLNASAKVSCDSTVELEVTCDPLDSGATGGMNGRSEASGTVSVGLRL